MINFLEASWALLSAVGHETKTGIFTRFLSFKILRRDPHSPVYTFTPKLYSSNQNALLKIPVRLFRSHCLMHHVFHHLAAELIGLAGGQHADSARGQRDRINLFKAAALNHNIKAEPVTAIEPPCGVEADGSRDRPFKII